MPDAAPNGANQRQASIDCTSPAVACTTPNHLMRISVPKRVV
jgi:hypothetical protein